MRKSGILPSCRSEQRLALDAGLCGGLIRGKGARLRIRHRLAPLPLAAPRGAAFAAPPASPSPECGIEGIPAAEGPHRAASGAAASGRQKASCQPHRRHPCRRASAAAVTALIEMEARGGGFVSRRGLPPLRYRGGGSQGAHPQPRSPRAASAPVAIGKAASPVSDLERIQPSSRLPAAAWHPAAVDG